MTTLSKQVEEIETKLFSVTVSVGTVISAGRILLDDDSADHRHALKSVLDQLNEIVG